MPTSLGILARVKTFVSTRLSCVTECLCLMPPHTGEVHSGGAGQPGAGQKVFCTGTEAEQPKYEGIVWPLHGEYCVNMERKWEREVVAVVCLCVWGVGGSKNSRTIFVTLWFVKVEVGH